MIRRNLFLKNLSAPLQIIMLILFVIISGFFVSLVGILISLPFGGDEIIKKGASIDVLSNINLLKFLQIINHLGLFLIPSIIFVYFISRSPIRFLKLERFPNMFTLLSGILVMLICMPLINWLLSINQKFHLPESMQLIENWMRETEERAAYYTEIFLNVKSVSALVLNIFMIAIIPAIGEEILFRGILIKLFRNWFGNIHFSIILSALIFSAVHLQFFGFLPRAILGVILGYLFYISRNLWVAILAHFINNAFAVLVVFLKNKNYFSKDIEKLGSDSGDYPLIIMSFLLTLIIILGINQRERRFKAIRFEKKKEEEF